MPSNSHEQETFKQGAARQSNGQSSGETNKTDLPDNLKSGIENLSGQPMDNIKVRFDSSQPSQISALAYAQGRDVHVAPGQERNLPHEAWHEAQQAQGRVKPSLQMKDGVPINDDKRLEQEADLTGTGKSKSQG